VRAATIGEILLDRIREEVISCFLALLLRMLAIEEQVVSGIGSGNAPPLALRSNKFFLQAELEKFSVQCANRRRRPTFFFSPS
jgi:hypothetical protein